jgi:phosphoglycerate dehydrogenase-like enzyme
MSDPVRVSFPHPHFAVPPRILVAADQLNDAHYERIRATVRGWAECERTAQTAPPPELAARVAAADIVVGWASAAQLLAGKTRMYLCGSAGLDGYLGAGLDAKPDFRICSAGPIMGAPIAEHLLAMMFAFTRWVPRILRQQRAYQWERCWEAGELAGTTACIVGLGSSGSALAERCRALGVRVIGVRRDAARGHPHAEKVFPVAQLKDAVRAADHVVAVIPGGPHTRHLFDGAVFDAMKPGAFFYTASRGSVTDEAALIARLRNGHLGGAGLDVFAQEPLPPTSPLWDFENVIVSPHSAGLSARLSDRLCELMCANLTRLRHGEPLLHEVNLSTYAAPLA